MLLEAMAVVSCINENVREWKDEDLILDQCCQGQKIKEVCEVFPHISIPIFSEALIVKSIPAQSTSMTGHMFCKLSLGIL